PSPTLLHGAFYRVGGVTTSNAEVRIDGRGWLPDRRVVRVQPGLTVAAAPLFVRATGTLTVHWNSEKDLAELDRSIGSCDEEERPQVVITISKCAGSRLADAESNECAVIREEKSESFFGSVTFQDVVPGIYRAEMRYGKLPPVIRVGNVAPLRVAEVRVNAMYFPLYGSVTHGGEPLGEDVRIELPGGIGFAPKDSEEYQALTRTPGVEPEAHIRVEACDGSPRALVLADEMARRSSRYNIDIPANTLEVQITDTFTREPLAGAMVKLEAMSVRKPSRVVLTTTHKADENGIVALAAVPVREILLTVRHPGYDPRRIDPFTMPKSGKHTVDAQLVPVRGTRGRIASNRAFEKAAVVWFSPTGSQTERVELAADGTFVYQNWHTAEETLAVVSASHPLWVMRAPESERRKSLELRFPDAPVAAFDVWLANAVRPDDERYIGVMIGGVRIPQPVLAEHQTLRRNPPLMRGAGPQPFRDLLGPEKDEIEPRERHLDLFAFVRYANVPRQRVEAGDVVFAVEER
ncbi:MAG TPA: carboxypeptidase-like regulatory domain-containing protein, partial [Thermoanaerobaculia bacterium]|nr:carboxypeptidase-like regulatory domain-containing protein [Thermoanaerobaculia bacterium]